MTRRDDATRTGNALPAPADPRPIRAGDSGALARLARRAFPPTQAIFVGTTGEGYVVEVAGGLAAAVVLRVLELPSGTRLGLIAWVMTDPDHQGRGLAPTLVRRGIQRLEQLGCTVILTEIEGHNTASMAVFRKLGFGRIGLRDEIRAFGLAGAAILRIRTFLALDAGHFLWMRGEEGAATSDARERLVAWSLNGGFALLALALGGGLLLPGSAALPSPGEALTLFLAVAMVLGLREAAMRAVARTKGLAVTYRAWLGGAGVSAAIALLFGSLFPLPGSIYPRAPDWRYPDALPTLGLAALAGAGVVAGSVALALATATSLPGSAAAPIAAAVLFVGTPLLLFDTAMAFPPFQAFAARRIHEFNRVVWAAAATAGLVLVLI
jgi:ribosomal protein S18 acetylase RimI-like enzyme